MIEDADHRQDDIKFTNPLDAYGTSIINITNPSDLVEQIENNLRGLRYNSDGELLTVAGHRPLINEEGIQSIVSVVQSLIAQNTVMGKLSNNDINEIMKNLIFTLTFQLMLNKAKWAISEGEDRTRILQICLPPCFITLKRSQEGGERAFWKGSIGEHMVHTSRENNKKGLLNKLSPWG